MPRTLLTLDKDGRAVIQAVQAISTEQAIHNARLNKQVVQSDKKLSSIAFTKRDNSDRWKADETVTFYKGLKMFGTDFGMIETLFEGTRTRNQIKVSPTLC